MGELRYEEIQAQAYRLWGYVAKGGSAALWLRSKDFAAEDKRAIEAAFARLRRRAR